MKVGLIGYYYNIEFFKSITESFNLLNIKVDFFPMLFYHHSNNNNLDHDFEQFLNNKSCDNKIIVSPGKIDVLIWMCFTAPPHIYKLAQECGIYNILYNHADPFETYESALKCNKLDESCKYIDMVFTISESSIPFYKKYNIQHVFHTATGYNQKIHNYNEKITYMSDVTCIFGNLYIDNIYGFDRFKLLEKISKMEDITFKIYGPSSLKQFFPDNYVDDIQINDTAKIFASSRININTHKILDNGAALNKRTYQIMASGGLMLMDCKSNSILTENKEYIRIDYDNIESQIKTILENYENNKYAEIKKKSIIKSTEFTYEKIVTDFVRNINKYLIKCENTDHNNIFDEAKTYIPMMYDSYNISAEIKLLLQLLKCYGPNINIFNQLNLLANIDGININEIINKFVSKV